MEHETKLNHETPPAAKPLLGVVFCSECNTRIETYNQEHMRWVELIDTETDTYLCSSECRIKMERFEEGF